MKIFANPYQLEQTASTMDQQILEYEQQYKQLYVEVDKMQNAWRGKDNVAYSEQIRSFEIEFVNMSELMKEYTSFLKHSALTYRNLQEELTNKARLLKF